MPTDPFVSPDPADRPRQQQNLPPGVATPPSARWVAERPGDRGGRAGADGGELRGSPGPNVGYAYTIAVRLKDELQLAPSEHSEDAMAVVAEIAGKRAALFGRAPVIGDLRLAMALLGYDGSADAAFATRRAELVREADHSYQRRRGVVDAVPDDLLRLPPTELPARVGAWRGEFVTTVAHTTAPAAGTV